MTETLNTKRPPMTPLRWFFAIVGGLIMLFAGGCGLFYTSIGALSFFQGDGYGPMLVVMGLMLGGVPAAFGWLIWWAAARRGRHAAVSDEPAQPA